MGRKRFAQVRNARFGGLRRMSSLERAGELTAGTVLAAFLLLLATFASAQTSRTPQKSQKQSNPLGQLVWRFIGPNGNRAAAIAGVAGNPLVAYVGAASGGIWKTENGGVNWKPVFDHEDVAAIGALAVSQSAPNVVWAGTGETWLIRPYYPMGDGVYMSSDGGAHWQHMGLEATGHIGRILFGNGWTIPSRPCVISTPKIFRNLMLC